MDHPEYFKSFADYKKSFLKFLYQTKKLIIANLSDPGVQAVMEVFQKDKTKSNHPEIIDYSKSVINFPLKIMGEYNKQNAEAVLQLVLALNINPEIIQESLQNFPGIGRRMEYLGEYHGAQIYSDFGHHPTEIKVTIKALKEQFPKRKIKLRSE